MSGTGTRDSASDLPSVVRSPANSGATSASPTPGATGAASNSSSRHAGPPSVLVVEDDRTARRAIASILRLQGFAVSEAGTLADAMRESSAGLPAWILLDLMLPDGNGTELLRRLRREPEA